MYGICALGFLFSSVWYFGGFVCLFGLLVLFCIVFLVALETVLKLNLWTTLAGCMNSQEIHLPASVLRLKARATTALLCFVLT